MVMARSFAGNTLPILSPPGRRPVRTVACTGTGPLGLGVAVALGVGGSCAVVGPVSRVIHAVDILSEGGSVLEARKGMTQNQHWPP